MLRADPPALALVRLHRLSATGSGLFLPETD